MESGLLDLGNIKIHTRFASTDENKHNDHLETACEKGIHDYVTAELRKQVQMLVDRLDLKFTLPLLDVYEKGTTTDSFSLEIEDDTNQRPINITVKGYKKIRDGNVVRVR